MSEPRALPSLRALVQQPEFFKTLAAQTGAAVAACRKHPQVHSERQRQGGFCPKAHSKVPLLLTISLVSVDCTFLGCKLSS